MPLPSLHPATVGWLLILGGCCANVLSLECIAKRDRGAGNLITFAQFAFIAAEGFIGQFDFRTFRLARRLIPLSTYLVLTALFLLASVLNNLALSFDISMPVHTVFRSSGLAGTLVTGWLFFGKRYSVHQVVSCLLVCVGVVSLTLADSAQARKLPPGCCGDGATALDASNTLHNVTTTLVDVLPSNSSAAGGVSALSSAFASSLPFLGLGPLLSSVLDAAASAASATDARWLGGIAMLTCTLFLLAVLGHLQEATYAKYGRVWREVMFMTHAVALPGFVLVGRDIFAKAVEWTHESTYATIVLPDGETTLRVSMYVFLLANLVTQSVCFKGVAILTSHTSALTCTIALTLRKFVSLVVSIVYFRNAFGPMHWLGAACVFGGIMAYSNEAACKRVWRKLTGQSTEEHAWSRMARRAAELQQVGMTSNTPFSPSLPPMRPTASRPESVPPPKSAGNGTGGGSDSPTASETEGFVIVEKATQRRRRKSSSGGGDDATPKKRAAAATSTTARRDRPSSSKKKRR